MIKPKLSIADLIMVMMISKLNFRLTQIKDKSMNFNITRLWCCISCWRF